MICAEPFLNKIKMKYVFSFLTGYGQDVDIATYKKEWINLYSESAAVQKG